MKKLLLVSFVLFFGLSTQVFANEFIVKSFKLDPADISARKYERRDINDEKCALIKIRTDIEGIKYDPRLGAEGSVDFKNGEYWLYVSPGEKVVKIIMEGFISLEYVIPIKIESSNVYKMELTGSERYTIRVNTDPGNVDFELDGKKYKTNSAIENIEPGTHYLQIDLPQYAKIIDTIYVSKSALFFEYELFKHKKVLVKFLTDPSQAFILMDGQPLGTTPKDVFTLTGEHQLTITRNKYIPIDTLINVVDGTNIFDFKLVKNASFLTVYKHPQEALLEVNGKYFEPGVEQEIGAAETTVTITCDKYYTYDTTFLAEKGKKYTINEDLKRHTGSLLILANPPDINFELIKGEDEVVFEWKGSNTLDKVPADMYKLKAFKKGYLEKTKPILVKKEQTHEFEFELEALAISKRSSAVAISLSAVIPGSGLIYSGKKRGYAYLAGFAGCIGTAVLMQGPVDDYLAAKGNYDNATTPELAKQYREEMVSLYDPANSAAKTRNMMMISAGVIYSINLIDAIISGSKSSSRKNQKVSVIAYPVNNTVALGVNFKIK